MIRFVAALLFLCSVGKAHSRDFGQIDKINEAFNVASKSVGSDQRMLLVSCSAELARVCKYTVSGGLYAMSSSTREDHKKARDIVILFGKGSDALYFIKAIGTTMLAFSPQADRDERGLALRTLMSGLEKKERREARLAGTTYKMLVIESAGLWLTVERE